MSLKYQDYYKTLGVARSVSQDEIKRAYRKLAQQYHPDVNKDKGAETKFKEINEANDVLKDPDKRHRYDQLGADWKAGQDFNPPPGYQNTHADFGGFGSSGAGGRAGGFQMDGNAFSDFFDMFFGQDGGPQGFQQPGSQQSQRSPFGKAKPRNTKRKGENHQATVTISLEEAYRGSEREIAIQGVNPDGSRSSTPRKLNVRIPAGTADGSKIRLKSQGSPGVNGGEQGDLILKIGVANDPRFEVKGTNLTTEVQIAPWEAALGAKVDVNTLDGVITLTLPAGSQSNQKLRLKGKGLPLRGKDDEKGDLFAKLIIVVPKELSDEDKVLFEKLNETSTFKPREET